MRILILILTVLFIASNRIHSQEDSNTTVITIDKKEYPITASCTSEERSFKTGTFSSYAKIEVKISGLQPGWLFTKLELNKAVDDTGKDLVRNKVEKLNDNSNFGSYKNEDPHFSFRLKNSNRIAKLIKEISGTLYLQNSDAANKIIIPDFKNKPGEYIVNEKLKKHDIKIAYINKETFDEKGSKIIINHLFPDSLNKDDPNIKHALESLKVNCTNPTLLTLIVDDPNKKILKLSAFDPKTNQSVKSISSFKGMFMIPVLSIHTDKEKKTNYSHLKITLKDKELVNKVNFQFKDIKLP